MCRKPIRGDAARVLMSGYYANITVQGPARDDVVAFLKKLGVVAYVSPAVKGATVVWHEDLASQVADLENERNAQAARLAAADSFATSLGPVAVHGQLAQRTVVLVTTADANPADRDAVKTLVANAGATVTGELQLTEAFSDPRRADQVDELQHHGGQAVQMTGT